ncbi:UDP-2,4-diacetamido-2,4,6-trideoxy-beta-L-altropyranose hydrolase [Candidatus Bipolaricaulota bacterium]
MNERSLLIRADANSLMGTGHLMRCLALAQSWKDSGGEVTFITACDSAGLLQRLTDEGFNVIRLGGAHPDPADWTSTSQVLAEHPNAWVVLDGYHFDTAYQIRVKDAGHRLLVIDDMADLEHYYADIVLNQNLHAEGLQYSCEPYTQLLLGSRYVLLRREFLTWSNWRREIPDLARKVLVTLGCGDPDNVTVKVIRAIGSLSSEDLDVRIVVEPSSPQTALLNEAIDRLPFNIHLLPFVEDMPGLMAWADMAVSGGGSTCWEMAFMGLPNVVVVLADNQRSIAEYLDKMGVSIDLGWHESVSAENVLKALSTIMNSRRQRIVNAEKGRNLIDGEGVARLCMILEERELRLRPARKEDCGMLWEWANDPDVRSASYSTEAISWEDHLNWFNGVAADPNCHIWVAVDSEDKPLGEIRFEAIGQKEAKIGVSIGREYRRKGFGSMLISLGVQEAFSRTSMQLLHAYVRQGNEASIRAFERAKFVARGTEVISGVESHHYVLERSDA